MPLNINGYNDTFKAFADFATQAKKGSTFAQISGEKNEAAGSSPLAGRTIVAKTSFDFIGNVGRFETSRDVNNKVRALFKQAIADMFGGPEKIPPSVQDAMKLEDFGKGKPLSARRIIAVKNAIDADGTVKSRATYDAVEKGSLSNIKNETFESHDVKDAALALGFTNAELPKLARATNLYAQLTGKTEMEAMMQVAETGTKANRLMQYGGRFLASKENFENGLRLMDSFNTWFTAARETKNADKKKTFDNAKSFTSLNLAGAVAMHDSNAALERFIFEDLAQNKNANLAQTDPEKIFGMKNNAAMRFFGTHRYGSFAGVMASLPPEKRGVFFAVFDKLSAPLPETSKDAKQFYAKTTYKRGDIRDPNLVICRILRHLPEIEKLMADGALTEENIVKTLCPDMPSQNWTLDGLNEFTHDADTIVRNMLVNNGIMDEDAAEECVTNIRIALEETCCTIQEAYEAVTSGKRVAPPPYMTTVTCGIEKLDGSTQPARDQLDGNGGGDLWRAYNYSPTDDPKNPAKMYIKDLANKCFGFNFPDGTVLKANASVHKDNIPTILDKLEKLAGNVHPRQQSALMFAVSQSGLGVLKGGLQPHGIASSEHACVDFTLSKDNESGAITVKYTSPKELPISFSWTSTIDVDGNVSTTPLVVIDGRKGEEPTQQLGANPIVDGNMIIHV